MVTCAIYHLNVNSGYLFSRSLRLGVLVNYRTGGKPAPGPLVAIHGFLNTWSDELGIEDLETAKATGQWLRAAGLWDWRSDPSENEARTLREFREVLRGFVLNRSSKIHVAKFNALIGKIGFTNKMYESGEQKLEVMGGRITYVIGTFVGIIYTSNVNGTWARFKCCQLDTCGWAFYDYSRNHSGRWCSMKSCGSRHKARRYQRRKAKHA